MPVHGRLAAGAPACFQFDLPKDTALSISAAARGFAPSLQVMRGANCDGALPQREARASSGGTARLDFVTGGGRYLVRVASVAPAGTGSFVLSLAKSVNASVATDTATPTATVPSSPTAVDPRVERMRQQVASHQQQVAAELARQEAERRQREAEAAVRRQQEAIERAEAEASRQQAFNAFIGGMNSVASDVAASQAQQQQMLDNLRQQLVQRQQAQQRAELERERQAQRAQQLAQQQLAQQERLRQAPALADARARQTAPALAGGTALSPSAGAATRQANAQEAEVQRRHAAEEAARRDEAARAKAEQQRAAAERQRQMEEAEHRRQLAWQQSLAQFKAQLRLHASQCPGGAGGYFVVGARPSFANCVTVHYEARCVGTPRGQGVRGSQGNFVGGSCQGMGDAIRIPGHLGCPVDQVIVEATEVTGC